MRMKRWGVALAIGISASSAWAGQRIDRHVAEAVQLIRTQAADHRLILLGEKHGTREIPELVQALAAAYAQDGPVLLGLEVHRSEHTAISRYLESDGGADARAALRRAPFWQVKGDQHDGRRSHDMLDLIEALRGLRAQGRDVAILPYDRIPGTTHDHHARSVAMARQVRAGLSALPRGRLLVLTGNVHAMLERPVDAPAQMQVPMGAWLRDVDPFAVEITARGGEFWACMARCAAMAEFPAQGSSGRTGGGPYQLRIVLPKFSVGRLLGDESG